MTAQEPEFRSEAGIPVGNAYDKYGAGNPIARILMAGFLRSFDDLAERTGAREVFEIGCGEGHLSHRLAERGLKVRACDFSEQIIAEATTLYSATGIEFAVRSVYDLEPPGDRAELVVCCEVLEHLTTPEKALKKLAELAEDWCILSVPREPLWRILNMARLKYWKDFGNTPGHLQHWSKTEFIRLAQQYFDIVEVRSPLPWTMLLCRARS